MSEITLNKDNFEEEVLKSNLPVLVDFWANWCGPCKIAAPMVEELAKEYDGKIKVGKVNVDENQELAAKFAIMSIPTFLIFKKGKIVSQFLGAQSKEKLEQEIEKVISE